MLWTSLHLSRARLKGWLVLINQGWTNEQWYFTENILYWMLDQIKQCILERCFISCCMKVVISLPNIATKFLISVWHNSNIKIANKRVFLNEILVRSKGCARLFLWRCTFLVFGVFQRTYNLSYKCVMHYTSIITVISKYLKILSSNKTLFKRFPNPNIPLFFEYIFLTEKCTRCIYKLLNNNEVVPIPNGRQI